MLVAGGALCGAAAGGWLFVMSDDEAGADVCCAIALNETNTEAVIIHFQLRITEILSVLTSSIFDLLLFALNQTSASTPPASLVGQLENHMYGRRRVDGLIVVLRGLKTHLICGFDGGFVQAMTHAPHHAIHV